MTTGMASRTWSDVDITGAKLRVMLLPAIGRVQISTFPFKAHPDDSPSPVFGPDHLRAQAAYLTQLADEIELGMLTQAADVG